MTDFELKVVGAMAIYGGDFVKALAQAFYRADSRNFYKLKMAFPEYWEEYTSWAKKDEHNGLQK